MFCFLTSHTSPWKGEGREGIEALFLLRKCGRSTDSQSPQSPPWAVPAPLPKGSHKRRSKNKKAARGLQSSSANDVLVASFCLYEWRRAFVCGYLNTELLQCQCFFLADSAICRKRHASQCKFQKGLLHIHKEKGLTQSGIQSIIFW